MLYSALNLIELTFIVLTVITIENKCAMVSLDGIVKISWTVGAHPPYHRITSLVWTLGRHAWKDVYIKVKDLIFDGLEALLKPASPPAFSAITRTFLS